jgi:phosphatidylglycerophosphatase C
VRTSTVADVLGAIEPLFALHPDGFVAFDADGTLWGGDVGEDLFHAVIAADAFAPAAAAAIERQARDHGLRVAAAVCDTARSIERAYLGGSYPELAYLELHAWALAGRTSAEAASFCGEVVERARVADRLHAETIEVLERLRATGLEILVVSASPRPIVEASAALVGIDPRHIVAATALYEGDMMLPDLDRPIPYGPGKVSRLRAARPGTPLLAAFGDNHFDAPMLREARVAVAVRPKPMLRQVAAEVPGLVELAERATPR